jgi:hypothetical protein
MTDTNDRSPPENVRAAAAIVDNWLRTGSSVLNTSTPQPRPETAAERFKRAREIDQSKVPPWRDPRGAA